jgi:hypothetical protein
LYDAPVVVGRFVLALSRSSSIQAIELEKVTLSLDSLTRLICSTQCLKKLVVNLILTEELGTISTRQTPEELPQNRSIEQLDIANVKEAFVIQMLNHFGSQSKLKRLSINTNDYTWRGESNLMSFSFSMRLQQLLESSSTLQSIELLDYYLHPSTFEPIAVGVMHSQSLQRRYL